MTDNESVIATTTDDENSVALFVKITPALEAELLDASKKTGVSKSGMVRMALPLGINNLLARINAQTTTGAELAFTQSQP